MSRMDRAGGRRLKSGRGRAGFRDPSLLGMAVKVGAGGGRRGVNVSDPYGLYRSTFGAHFKEFVYFYMYKANPWVRACVNRIAEEATRMDFEVQHVKGLLNGQPRPAAKELQDWLARQKLRALLEATIRDTMVYGKGFVAIEPTRGGKPASLYRLDARITDPVVDETNNLLSFRQTWLGTEVTFEVEEVIYWYIEGPPGPYLPDPIMDSLLDTVEADARQRKFKTAFLRNAALISMILETETTDDGVIKANREYVRSELSGEEKAGRALVLGGVNKLLHFGSPRLDVALADLAKIGRQEVCAVYGVPEAELGVGDDANRSTKGGMRQTFVEGTVAPLQTSVCGEFDEQFVHREPPGWGNPDLSLKPTPFPKQAGAEEARVADSAAKIGTIRDDLLEMLGLPPLGGERGSEFIMLATAKPVPTAGGNGDGAAPAGSGQEGEDADGAEEEPGDDDDQAPDDVDEDGEPIGGAKSAGQGLAAEKQDDAGDGGAGAALGDGALPEDGDLEEYLSEAEEWARVPSWLQAAKARAVARARTLAEEQMNRRRLTFGEIPAEEWARAEQADAASEE
jgi:HK97 family phage portal protein